METSQWTTLPLEVLKCNRVERRTEKASIVEQYLIKESHLVTALSFAKGGIWWATTYVVLVTRWRSIWILVCNANLWWQAGDEIVISRQQMNVNVIEVEWKVVEVISWKNENYKNTLMEGRVQIRQARSTTVNMTREGRVSAKLSRRGSNECWVVDEAGKRTALWVNWKSARSGFTSLVVWYHCKQLQQQQQQEPQHKERSKNRHSNMIPQ